MRKLRFRYRVGDQVVDVDVMIGRAADWSAKPQSKGQAWLPYRLGKRSIVAMQAPQGMPAVSVVGRPGR